MFTNTLDDIGRALSNAKDPYTAITIVAVIAITMIGTIATQK